MIDCIWIPNISLGPFKLGEKISYYESTMGILLDPDLEEEYNVPNSEIFLSSENGLIDMIYSYETCFYKGTNIIGLSIQSVPRLLGCNADEVGSGVEYDDGDIQYPYEFEDLGLRLWVRDNRVVSAAVTCYPDD
ncbi:hypothetical protein O4H49_14330 [Kiloniella laminariae]|uniref:Uncharacterized protein n=1 Tax=Kiloniella laminariae TaxID=454162 RepID=A0ABT4LLH2_9PROT|nr:hypothetical protein [Kiloniella laminariae]MCZ4281965.1 hypothetical protein [Kiloniella laminariae]